MELAPAPPARECGAALSASSDLETMAPDSDPAAVPSSNGKVADLEKKAPDLESPESRSGNRKNGRLSDCGHSIRRSVKFAPQFKKTQHRKNPSPIDWFPRKKHDSFLMRKIRHLQEVEGMNLSLDETLGKANLHYTRVEREKIAAKEAAKKAMSARKVAMIEGSWCRILKAARIQNKEAEAEFEKAKKYEIESFEAARSLGVMMYDRPDSPRRPWKVESSSAGGGPSTHKVTASFETAFDVDKEVSAAVKEALVRLATCPSYANKEEFHDLLRKISENPDNETNRQTKEDSELDSVGPEFHRTDFSDDDAEEKNEQKQELQDLSPKTNLGKEINRELNEESEFNDIPELKLENKRFWKHSIGYNRNSKSSQELVNKMLDRLKGLQEDELASLAIIVATCGLNAALLEVENDRYHHGCESITSYLLETETTRTYGSKQMDGNMEGKETGIELPGLEKILVKRVSRLEREVQEARRNSKCNSVLEHPEQSSVSKKQFSERRLDRKDTATDVPSLDQIFVKRVSKLEREVQEARISENTNSKLSRPKYSGASVCSSTISTPMEPASDLGSVLVKHVSKLEREIQGAKNSRTNNGKSLATENRCVRTETGPLPAKNLVEQKTKGEICEKSQQNESENLKIEDLVLDVDTANNSQTNNGKSLVTEPLPAKNLVEQKTKGEICEKSQQNESEDLKIEDLVLDVDTANNSQTNNGKSLVTENRSVNTETEPLPTKILVEQKTEEEICEKSQQSESENLKTKNLVLNVDTENIDINTLGSTSINERKPPVNCTSQTERISRKQQADVPASEEGVDKIFAKHVSRLRKGRMSLGKRVNIVKTNHQVDGTESLGDILVKHQTQLEKAKATAAQSWDADIKHAGALREARERKLQEAWQGVSLGDSVQPRISQLELDKAASKTQGLLEQNDYTMKRNARNHDAASEGLDKILVKHVSRLEKEKLAAAARSDVVEVKKKAHQVVEVESLADILVKHQPKPEMVAAQPLEDGVKGVNFLREARERELREAWGGMSLGNSVRPHVSKLELDKAAWRRAEEEERKQSQAAMR